MKKKLALLIALAIGSTCMAQSAFTNYPWMSPTPAGVYTLTEEMPMELWIDVINFNMQLAGGAAGSAFKIDVINGIGTNLAVNAMTVTDGLDISGGATITDGGASVTGAVSVVGDVGVTGNIITSGTNTTATLIADVASIDEITSVTNSTGHLTVTGTLAIPTGSIGSTEIDNGSIQFEDINADAVEALTTSPFQAYTHVATVTGAKTLTSADGNLVKLTLSGDCTLDFDTGSGYDTNGVNRVAIDVYVGPKVLTLGPSIENTYISFNTGGVTPTFFRKTEGNLWRGRQ